MYTFIGLPMLFSCTVVWFSLCGLWGETRAQLTVSMPQNLSSVNQQTHPRKGKLYIADWLFLLQLSMPCASSRCQGLNGLGVLELEALRWQHVSAAWRLFWFTWLRRQEAVVTLIASSSKRKMATERMWGRRWFKRLSMYYFLLGSAGYKGGGRRTRAV